MPRSSINAQIVEIISAQLSLDAGEVKTDSRFVDDLGADSLDLIEIIMELEEEFNIEIPDEAVEKIVSVKDVIEYISQAAAKE